MNDSNAAAGLSRERPRHFWAGPNPVAASAEEKQGSPVAQLYQHALESVFGFLSLHDLSRVMAVSRAWCEVVRAMPCAQLVTTCSMPRLVPLCASTLSKHIVEFGEVESVTSELSCEALYTVALRLPQLCVLICTILPTEVSMVILPHKLVTLDLDLSKITGAGINAIIKGISQLKALVTLVLVLPSFLPAISFAPLAIVVSLQDLSLLLDTRSEPTDAQVDNLRVLSYLHLMHVHLLSTQSLARLLRTPHELRWQEIGSVGPVDAVASAALVALPSLQKLFAWDCTDIGFLSHLMAAHVEYARGSQSVACNDYCGCRHRRSIVLHAALRSDPHNASELQTSQYPAAASVPADQVVSSWHV